MRRKAGDLREKAAKTTDPFVRVGILKAAAVYEELAAQLEKADPVTYRSARHSVAQRK